MYVGKNLGVSKTVADNLEKVFGKKHTKTGEKNRWEGEPMMVRLAFSEGGVIEKKGF